MSTHRNHDESETFYFITFTCFKWLPLFEETKIYDYLPFWFDKIKQQGGLLSGYVIMPNHMHLIIYLKESKRGLNKIIAESKRFLAYEIVRRLKLNSKLDLLARLSSGVQPNEKAKKKKHQVFRLSFDAKPLDEKEVETVLDYIHRNPVSGKWNLVEDFTDYLFSSSIYYELGKEAYYQLEDFRNIISESSKSDSE
jgi:REP element-mobilizing transposase RayT